MNTWANLKIRKKLLISFLSLFIFYTTAGSLTIYVFVRKTIERNMESELKNSTTTLFNMVRTSVSVSIKNHLRAVAERNRDVCRYYYSLFEGGEITEREAMQNAAVIIQSQTIGKSGYIYCIDSHGIVTVHPQKKVLGNDVSNFEFVKVQMERKEGYVEYQWKNPNEVSYRPKSLYMAYFEPWDWIISASSYRKEFAELINVDDFRESVLSLKFGKTGYSYVTDGRGNTVIHPKMEGVNIYAMENVPTKFLNTMLERKMGKIVYEWRNPDETEFRKKLVLFNYMPEFDWIVASSSYLDEFYAPLLTVRNIILITACMTILLAVPLIYKISASMTTPMRELMKHLEASGLSGDFTARSSNAALDETGILSAYFNTFMERLEKYSENLKQEIAQRRHVEQALLKSQERYREALEMGDRIQRAIGQELHDDLCPHLIGVEGFCRVLNNRLKTEKNEHASMVTKIGSLIAEATDKARNVSRGLFPTQLVNSGLVDALNEMCENVEGFSQIRCTFRNECNINPGEEQEAHLYYIVQEAVYNAVKHGDPSMIDVRLQKKDDDLFLIIEDDGTGIDPTKKIKGVGRIIMMHRAKQINCSISWEGIGNRGTKVIIRLPQDMLRERGVSDYG